MKKPPADRGRPGRFSANSDGPARRVTVHTTATGIEVRDEMGLLVTSWQTADLRTDGTLPGGGVRLRCVAEAGARLEVIEAASAGGEAAPGAGAMPFWSRSWVQAVAVTLLGLGIVSIPFLLRPTDLVPQSAPSAAALHACHGPAGEAALAGLVARLTVGLSAERRARAVAVVDSPSNEVIALADGTVMLPVGFLRSARGADEVAEALARVLAGDDAAAQLRQAGIGTNRPPALREAEWQALLRICR
jgi:hypothetical protein